MTSPSDGWPTGLEPGIDLALSWIDSRAVLDIDLFVLLVGADDKVTSDADFVFYNQPAHPSGAVEHRGRTDCTEHMSLDLGAVPAQTTAIIVGVCCSNGSLDQAQALQLVVRGQATGTVGARSLVGPIRSATAVLGRLRRHAQGWVFVEDPQEWASGLGALASSFGVYVEGSPGSTADATSTGPGNGDGSVPPPDTASEDPTLVRHRLPAGVSSTEPAVDGGGSASRRRRVVRGEAPREAAAIGSASVELWAGSSVILQRPGERQPTMWLRVLRVGLQMPHDLELSVLSYGADGQPRKTLTFSSPELPTDAVRLIISRVGDTAESAAAVSLRLDLVPEDTAAFVFAVTSYGGISLGPGAVVTELVDLGGAPLARAECPAPPSSAVLIARLARDLSGSWFLTALATPGSGRTGLGLVGTGRWALSC